MDSAFLNLFKNKRQFIFHERPEGGGFRDNELPTEIYIHPLHLNMQAKFHTITKSWGFEETIRKWEFAGTIYLSRTTPGGGGGVFRAIEINRRNLYKSASSKYAIKFWYINKTIENFKSTINISGNKGLVGGGGGCHIWITNWNWYQYHNACTFG